MPAITSTPAQSLPLQTISPRGKPPKSRIGGASEAHSIYGVLWEAGWPRFERARIIQGAFDGNPPYDQNKLRKRNEGWRGNFNSQEAPARKEAAKTPYYELTTSVELYADCGTEVETPNIDAATASRIRSEEFDRLLKGWAGYDANFWTMLDDFIAFNKGFLFWPRRDSWHFKRVPWSRMLFPNGTGCDPDEWECFVICHDWTVTRFYSFIADEAAAKAGGWDLDACYEAIRLAQPRNMRTYRDPLALQQALRDSDLYLSAQSQTVQCASVFVREFDGTWSRMIVNTPEQGVEDSHIATPQSRVESQDERATTESADERASRIKSDTHWLYFKQNIAEDIYQILSPFIYEMGDGSINALTGLGPRLISLVSAKDRLRCEAVNNAFMRSAITLQAQSAGAMAKASLMQVGPLTVIPPGFAVQPGNMFGDMTGTLALVQEFNNETDVNTGTYRPTFEKPQGNPETATAASARYAQATILSNSAVNRYYKQLDRFYEEVYRRVSAKLPASKDKGVKSAREFQDRCRRRGLSDEQIRDCQPGLIRAQRAIGNGSPLMRQQMLGSLLPLALQTDAFGPRGRKELFKSYVAAHGGQHLVDRLFPIEDEAQVPTRDEWDAVSENADLQQGSPVVLAGWQDHWIHVRFHLQAGQAAIQAVQQGANPAQAWTFLQDALPHIQGHVVMMRDQQRRQVAAQGLQELMKAAKEVEGAVQQQMQQQGQQQKLSFEQQLQLQQAANDAKLKEFRSTHSAQIKEQQARERQKLEQQQATHSMAIADAEAAARITRDTASTASKLRMDAASHEAELRQQEEAHRLEQQQAAMAAEGGE